MPEGDGPEETLDELRRRVRATQDAAERLVREATEQARETPPRGWEGAPASATREVSEEVRALASLLEAIRDLLPPDLREQIAELVRQLLLVVRALIDWLVDRLDPGPRGSAPEVEDIPIG